MSEEQQEQSSGGGSIKNIIIGLVSTVTLGVGGFITNKLTGGGDEKEATPVQQAAPVINITNSNQQAQSVGGGTKVIERVVEKPAAQPTPKPKKKEGDEFKEAAPQW
jgi:outer membrane scaffolding protein for murein synthesis (MipA/OmpV family)